MSRVAPTTIDRDETSATGPITEARSEPARTVNALQLLIGPEDTT